MIYGFHPEALARFKQRVRDILTRLAAFCSIKAGRRVYVVGYTKDILKYKHLIEPNDPRRSLFIYHELREEEESQWLRASIVQGLKAQELETLTHLLENLGTYSSEEMENFVDIIQITTDGTLAQLCRSYRSGSHLTQSFLRSQITPEQACLLLTFSKRAAVLAVRVGNMELVEDSLTALAIENLACEDVRDDLVALALIFHSAKSLHSPLGDC